MKISDLKTIIKEELNALDHQTAREIDLMIDMGHELLAYQNSEIREESFSILKDKLINLHRQSSVKGYEDDFATFIENNYENDLPNQSSGSFLTALTDIDGLLYGLGYEGDEFTDEQYDAATDYYESRRRELF